ncbi:hypothetical protein B7C42_07615 [Nocardia cerradoensis]|uniref:Uncharacterized protein n=1 Tax=Nocardia cerradoensis TaxID=85688 RepID=A0A231GUI1_9NOCA|nr:hypothetical protein B7C42_07615 [Nocardia cerradoensis]
MDALVVEVEPEPGRFCLAELESGGGFGGVGEADHVRQGDRVGAVGGVDSGAAGVDGRQLFVIADAADGGATGNEKFEQLQPFSIRQFDMFVDDHERLLVHLVDPHRYGGREIVGRPHLVGVVVWSVSVEDVQESVDGLHACAGGFGEDRGGGGLGREAENCSAGCAPGVDEHAHGGGFPGARRCGGDGDAGGGGGEVGDHGGLAGVEFLAVVRRIGVVGGDGGGHETLVDRACAGLHREFRKAVFEIELARGSEVLCAGAGVDAGAVATLNQFGHRGQGGLGNDIGVGACE